MRRSRRASASEDSDSGQLTPMLGIIAAVLFAIAFILNAAGTSVSAVFSPFSLMLIGLTCLALHLSGIGTGWRLRR
jgi:hypothetical protein